MPLTQSSTFYRNLWRLTERSKKRKNEGLTNSHSNSDEAVNDYSNMSQQIQRSAEVSYETQNVFPPKKNVVHRGMDRIQRSFRESFHRRMSKQHFTRKTRSKRQHSPNRPTKNSDSGKTELWQPDEIAVRNGTCSFSVKYLGGIEVFESRGMQICEGALQLLRGQRRRPIKAVLYISGDGLRVVDQESSRGLIVDQTIEKVSFCAPDRSHDKGFAYICRDGTSRRWMCHGFHAVKESGERLSHAVGCAFAVCLERKKKRDAETAAVIQTAAGLPPLGSERSSATGFTLGEIAKQAPSIPMSAIERNSCNGSFRRLSLTERLRDPQTAIVQPPPAASNFSSALLAASKPRPVGNPLLFVRQGSLRAPASSFTNNSSFHRQLSLRSYPDSPTKKQQQISATVLAKGEPIFEDDEEKNWSNDGVLNEGSTFENAPYWPVKRNGFRQSSSYMTVPYTNTNDFSSIQLYGSVNSPLQVQTTYSSNVSGPESWLSSPVSTCPSTAKSKADEWLEQTLRSSLSLHSPYRNTTTDSSGTSHTTKELPPNHPSPSLLCSSVFQDTGSDTAIRFSNDFSQCKLPSTTENCSSLTKNAMPKSLTAAESEIDVFGQPVFSALLSKSESNHKQNNQVNGYMSNKESDKRDEIDPFDIRWPHLAVDVAGAYPVPVHSTNPFYSESSAVKI